MRGRGSWYHTPFPSLEVYTFFLFLFTGAAGSLSSTPTTAYAALCCSASVSSSYPPHHIHHFSRIHPTRRGGGKQTTGTHLLIPSSYSNSVPSSASNAHFPVSLDQETRGSASNSSRVVGNEDPPSPPPTSVGRGGSMSTFFPYKMRLSTVV